MAGGDDDQPKPVPKFVAPVIQDNVNGWGPCDMPEQFKDMPYQPFSKGDRLGKVSTGTICSFYLITFYCNVVKILK